MTPSRHAFFITGTDTEIGKTFVASTLLHYFAQQGYSTLGLKPVAAGTDAVGHNDDVESLKAASSVSLTTPEICPYLLPAAIAPHLAAAEVGRRLEIPVMQQAFIAQGEKPIPPQAKGQLRLVEGVGGFVVPLNDHEDTADLAQALQLPVILVVGMRLGCISHALLTAQAIRASGLTLAGWIANSPGQTMPYLEDNISAIAGRIQAPLLARLPDLSNPDLPTITEAADNRPAAAARWLQTSPWAASLNALLKADTPHA